MAKLEVEIFDDMWPKLRLVGSIRHSDGRSLHFDEKVLYDQAYSKFEGTLHNMLRPMVQNIIDRRKNPSRHLGIAGQTADAESKT